VSLPSVARVLPDRFRPNRHERGYGYDWEKVRAEHLRLEPHCRRCGNPASDVDHIIPKRAGGSDDHSNLQSLCHAHHSSKTAKENRWRKRK
jgi:5-methylcytosine-specific restriction protein A